MVGREKELFKKMGEAFDFLKGLMGKVKTEGVKDGVDRAALCFDKLKKARTDLRAEYLARMETADREIGKADTKMADRVQVMEDKVMGVLEQVADKLAVRSVALPEMAYSSPPQPRSEEQPWAEVVRRNATRRTRPVVPPAGKVGTVKMPRTRPLAIMVKLAGEDFPALLKTVRQKVDPGVTGNSIGKLRKTNAGDLLVEINGGSDSAEVVRAELVRSLGPEARVRKLENSSAVEIRDLDAETTRDEVLEAVGGPGGPGDVRLVSLRQMYGGAQAAIVSLPAMEAKRLCSAGRLRVGLVYARVRSIELPDRCYRCLAFGHVRRDCTDVVRENSCRRCGNAGHMARECGASLKEVEAFRSVLVDAARRHKEKLRAATGVEAPRPASADKGTRVGVDGLHNA